MPLALARWRTGTGTQSSQNCYGKDLCFLSCGSNDYITTSRDVDREIVLELQRNMKIHYPVKKVYVPVQIADFQLYRMKWEGNAPLRFCPMCMIMEGNAPLRSFPMCDNRRGAIEQHQSRWES